MRGLITYFTKFPAWTNSLLIVLIVLGLVSSFEINRSLFPERRVSKITIDVPYPGASPAEVEEGITLKIENTLKGVLGVDYIESTSTENSAKIDVFLKRGHDPDELLSDVKNAVDQISSFPEDAEKPRLYKEKRIDHALSLTLYGNDDLFELKKKAERIEDDFLSSGLISQIEIYGYPTPEVSIEVQTDKMREYQVTLEQIRAAVLANNLDFSAGRIKTRSKEYLLRSWNKTLNKKEIENIVIRNNPGGRQLLLKEVASVNYQFSETPNSVYFNGKRAVKVFVKKIPEEDILEITEWVREYIDIFNEENPEQIHIIRDTSVSVKGRLNLLVKNGSFGLVLVLVTLGLFLNLRLSFWVALGIPVSMLGMLLIAYAVGITINQITMFGMILVVGILVDDGIVISENIHSKMERGVPPLRACIDGTMEVLPAVFTSILTTVMAFTIFFFLEGRIGEFMVEMAIVVIACLSVSLVEAAVVLPSHLYTRQLPKISKFRRAFNNGFERFRDKTYGRSLKFLMKWRWIAVFAPLSFIAITIGMLRGGVLKTSMFPNIDSNYLTILLEMPVGTSDKVTLEKLQSFEREIKFLKDSLRNAEESEVIEGSLTTLAPSGGSTSGNSGQITVQLVDAESRNFENEKIGKMIRRRIGKVEDAKSFQIGGRHFFGRPVSIILTSKDAQELDYAKKELKEALSAIPELTEITDDDLKGNDEINIVLKEKAYSLGFTSNEISSQIRSGFFGREVQRIQQGNDEVRIWVRLPEQGRQNFDQLQSFRIMTASGEEYPLSELVKLERKPGVTAIRHYNRMKKVLVEANLKDPNTPLTPILDQLNSEILPDILNRYPSIQKLAGGQERESEKLMGSLKIAGLTVLFLIFIVIGLTFRSGSQPFLIVAMIPVGVFCGVFGHYLEGKTVVIMSWFGLIAVSGVIVNDAVVFLDKYNRNIKSGMSVFDALYNAGISRYRAILLTSITTVVGLYPIIWETSLQAQFLIPMAISVAYGVFIGTLFILFFFPVIVYCFNDLRWFWKFFRTGKRPLPEEAEPAFRERQRLKNMELESEQKVEALS